MGLLACPLMGDMLQTLGTSYATQKAESVVNTF